MKNFRKLTRSQRGQSSVEYLLIVAVLVVVIFAFGGKFKTGIENLTNDVFSSMGSRVKKSISGANGI